MKEWRWGLNRLHHNVMDSCHACRPSQQVEPWESSPIHCTAQGGGLSYGSASSAFETPAGRWQPPGVSPAGGFTFGGAQVTPSPTQDRAQYSGLGAQLMSHAIMGHREGSEVMTAPPPEVVTTVLRVYMHTVKSHDVLSYECNQNSLANHITY